MLSDPASDVPAREALGTMIGRYKLLQEIGEGGFGIVYMAEQTEPVRRMVALKVPHVQRNRGSYVRLFVLSWNNPKLDTESEASIWYHLSIKALLIGKSHEPIAVRDYMDFTKIRNLGSLTRIMSLQRPNPAPAMKCTKHRSPAIRSVLLFSHAISVALVLALPAVAEFSGNDSLDSKSSNWDRPLADVGGAKLVFRNSRLEYQVKSPAHKNKSTLRWTPNEGAYDQDWFVQVDVKINNFPLNKGRDTDLNVGVVNTQNPKKEYMIGFDHSRTIIEGIDDTSIYTKSIQTSSSGLGWPFAPSVDGTYVKVRLHFDSHSKSLTGSWKSGNYWRYFDPEPVFRWGMEDGDTFTAMLTASSAGFAQESIAPVVPPGTAWFRNFMAGRAIPEIAVDQPAGSSLKGGKGKRSFGTIAVGDRASRTFAIYNMGTAKLNDLKISKSGPNAADFTLSKPSETSLKPGAATDFAVTLRPTGTGTRTATIHIASNDPQTPSFDFKLAGEGAR